MPETQAEVAKTLLDNRDLLALVDFEDDAVIATVDRYSLLYYDGSVYGVYYVKAIDGPPRCECHAVFKNLDEYKLKVNMTPTIVYLRDENGKRRKNRDL